MHSSPIFIVLLKSLWVCPYMKCCYWSDFVSTLISIVTGYNFFEQKRSYASTLQNTPRLWNRPQFCVNEETKSCSHAGMSTYCWQLPIVKEEDGKTEDLPECPQYQTMPPQSRPLPPCQTCIRKAQSNPQLHASTPVEDNGSMELSCSTQHPSSHSKAPFLLSSSIAHCTQEQSLPACNEKKPQQPRQIIPSIIAVWIPEDVNSWKPWNKERTLQSDRTEQSLPMLFNSLDTWRTS